jgi:hypothetical protein
MYKIAASVSMASTTTSSAAQNAGTTFNFNSPYATGGNPVDLSEPTAPATATSSASEGGNAAASSSGTGVNTPASGGGLNLSSLLLYGAIGFGAYLLYKHMKGGG